MKTLVLFLSLCSFCACNTMYVAGSKNPGNTTSIGVEWNYGDVPNETLQRGLDSAMLVALGKFNAQTHSFSVHRKMPRDKDKDYLAVDFEKGKVVSTGGKVAGYVVTAVGLATPFALVAAESPVIFAFYYWPYHNVRSKVTLSPALSDDRRNSKNLIKQTGALFASTNGQVQKLVQKYADGFYQTLLDVETQLAQHR